MSGSMFDMLRKRNERFKRRRKVFLIRCCDVSCSFGEFLRESFEKELQEKMLRELKKEIERKAKSMLSTKNSGQHISRDSLIRKSKCIHELENLVSYPVAFVRSRCHCRYRKSISMRTTLKKKIDKPNLDLFISEEQDNCAKKKTIVKYAFGVLDVNCRIFALIQHGLANLKMRKNFPSFSRT